jgi:hypothetical protein
MRRSLSLCLVGAVALLPALVLAAPASADDLTCIEQHVSLPGYGNGVVVCPTQTLPLAR